MRRILDNRQYFMGCAIALIMLSHLLSVCKELKPLWVFYPGFIGVDIFLFLSGYGLCRSFENNDIRTFYKRRIQRILPMFLCFQLFISVFQMAAERSANLWDIICNFTTLSFWGLGGWTAEWYLSFLFYLYLLFPLIYRLASRLGVYATLTCLAMLAALQYSMNWPWNIDAAFSRIPIFMMGIVCYLAKDKSKAYLSQAAAFTITIPLFVWMVLTHRAEKYEIVYMFAPCFMILASYASKVTITSKNIIYAIFEFLGKHSIELYVANMMTLSIIQNLSIPVYPRLAAYIISQIVLSWLMIKTNRILNKCL